MAEQFKTAQDVLTGNGGSAWVGFNRRVYGDSYADAFQYQHERSDGAMQAGWSLADKMIREGRLFYFHNFHFPPHAAKGCCAFQYGGTWVCNGCNRDHLDREWWKIKVMKDGNAWCCVGTGFKNLQESDNYAFGDTREQAIENYGRQMTAPASGKGE
jgi:hypothetical protein